MTASYTVPSLSPVFSAGIGTDGNTAGSTGNASQNILFVGGNNITLSGSTNGGASATITIVAPDAVGTAAGVEASIYDTRWTVVKQSA